MFFLVAGFVVCVACWFVALFVNLFGCKKSKRCDIAWKLLLLGGWAGMLAIHTIGLFVTGEMYLYIFGGSGMVALVGVVLARYAQDIEKRRPVTSEWISLASFILLVAGGFFSGMVGQVTVVAGFCILDVKC